MRRGAVVVILLILLLGIGGAVAAVVLSGGGGGGGSPIAGIGGSGPTPTPEIPEVPVVVARVEIEGNTLITDQEVLEVEQVPENERLENTFTNPAEVLNMLAITDIPAGKQITQSDITEPGLSQQIPEPEEGEPAPKAYPMLVNVLTGVADQVKVGDSVDVVATINVPRRVATPSNYDFDNNLIQYTVEIEQYFTTKTIVQQAQVLRVLRPEQRTEEGEDGEEDAPPPGGDIPQEGEPPPTDAEGRPVGTSRTEPGEAEAITAGSWAVVLAVSDQEAEYIELARAQEARITLVLRGSNDDQFEETAGATIDLMITDVGLPVPEPILPPAIVSFPDSTIQ